MKSVLRRLNLWISVLSGLYFGLLFFDHFFVEHYTMSLVADNYIDFLTSTYTAFYAPVILAFAFMVAISIIIESYTEK